VVRSKCASTTRSASWRTTDERDVVIACRAAQEKLADENRAASGGRRAAPARRIGSPPSGNWHPAWPRAGDASQCRLGTGEDDSYETGSRPPPWPESAQTDRRTEREDDPDYQATAGFARRRQPQTEAREPARDRRTHAGPASTYGGKSGITLHRWTARTGPGRGKSIASMNRTGTQPTWWSMRYRPMPTGGTISVRLGADVITPPADIERAAGRVRLCLRSKTRGWAMTSEQMTHAFEAVLHHQGCG